MRCAKIVATMGPACNDTATLIQMAKAGMNMARFNMSHGTHASHHSQMDKVRDVRTYLGMSLPIMVDTKGPEIRIKKFEHDKIILKSGDKFILTTNSVTGTNEKVSITYADLPGFVGRGTKILLNDGLIELRVLSANYTDILCEVVYGGDLTNNKSINIPNVDIHMPYLSEDDKKDITFAYNEQADYLAISFVKTAADVMAVREFLGKLGENQIKIISKIECKDAIKNIDAIINVSDGIMVARGDLGAELPFEQIPKIQKDLIAKSRAQGKMVITATEMLESMIENPMPTRAEISDVANAVLDGTGAIMLSGETSVGKHPVLVIETMAKIALECENSMARPLSTNTFSDLYGDVTGSVAFGACALAQSSNAKAIIVVTKTGTTAVEVSRFRPKASIIGCTPSEKVYQQMGAVWGIMPIKQPELDNTAVMLEYARNSAKEHGIVAKGDLVVQTAGQMAGISGSNMLILNYV